jgi:UrcA family protein
MNTNTHRSTKTVTLAAAICFAAAAFGAHAGEMVNDVQTVKYADLNLNTQAGVAVLYKRIRNAAEQVCGDVGARELAQAAAAKACVDQAIVATVHAVNNPMLTAENGGHVGAPQKQINVADLR